MKLNLTPKEIVQELDQWIIGQGDAKKSVAIALRNRWRRQNVEGELRDEIVPKNILMIGPTGVGKTEIARRLAKLADAPFIKVEATKFTEVGYVGRDVDSIIRDLLDMAILQVKERKQKEVTEKAAENAKERIVNALVGETSGEETKQKFRTMLESGELEEKEIEISVKESSQSGSPFFDIPGMPGGQMGIMNLGEMLGKMGGGSRTKPRKMLVKDARKIVIEEETEKLVDNDKLIEEAIKLTENSGIVFIDEIDKIASRGEFRGGDVSREGVQRDLLPLIEGTIVTTKHGTMKTDHILFIASGAFHLSKPSDLLPELQGRLPIRVQLKPLEQEDMVRIMTEKKASLIKQYQALLKVEELEISFTQDAIEEIARIATEANSNVENIGARRLHTILEKLVEELSFNAPDMKGEKIVIDKEYVLKHLSGVADKADVSKFIL